MSSKHCSKKLSTVFHNIHFCLIWKSEGDSLIKVIENELKPNFEKGDSSITEEIVKSFFE